MTSTAPMTISARRAAAGDVAILTDMYGRLADEQRAIRAVWPHADGLAEPVRTSLEELIDTEDATVIVGEIDGVPLGFLAATEEPLLVPMSDRRIGVIRLIFTEHEARGVGVGAAMLAEVLGVLKRRGVDLFDARVSPGHRMAKNFFESSGFKARSITMHRSDEVES